MKNELHNRTMHIRGMLNQTSNPQSVNNDISKCKNCTLEELSILKILRENPGITQKDLAKLLGKSERTIKSRTVEMQNNDFIVRENGKRNGKWKVLI